MAEAGNGAAGFGLLGEVSQWPLQRYGRFRLSAAEESPGPGPEAVTAPSPTWKVFDSNEESGYLVLTIVISGHFFISQGQTLLEGFSLIGSKNWLKIVRRMDCLLFGTTIKNKSRMFRVQFSGESKEAALEHCCRCVQSLAQYVTVQVPDTVTQELWSAGESQGKDCAKSVPLQPRPHLNLEQQACVAARTGELEGRTSVPRLAQEAMRTLSPLTASGCIRCSRQQLMLSTELCMEFINRTILASEELPPVYEQPTWGAEELGPFLRLCLMDRNFPAFVEEVEKELTKLTGLRD